MTATRTRMRKIFPVMVITKVILMILVMVIVLVRVTVVMVMVLSVKNRMIHFVEFKSGSDQTL